MEKLKRVIEGFAESITGRLFAGAAILVAIAIGVGAVLITGSFEASVARRFDAQLEADMAILIANADPAPAGRPITVSDIRDPRFDKVFSGWYWQVRRLRPQDSAGPPLGRSRSLADSVLTAPAATIADADTRFGTIPGPDGQNLRFVARDVLFPATTGEPPDLAAAERDNRYLFVVAAQKREIEEEIAIFRTYVFWGAAALVLLLTIVTVLMVGAALRPVGRVVEALRAIERGKAQRIAGAVPTEIRPLAEAVNSLLAHNADMVERSRTQVGNLAHALKTPLAVLQSEAHGDGGPLAAQVVRQTAAMRRQIDHYLARARAAAATGVLGATTELQPVFDDLARTLEKIYGRRGIEIVTTVPPGLLFRGERQDLEEMIGNLLDNACKFATAEVTLAGAPGRPGRLAITVADDGPGLSAEDRTRVMRRGERLDETVPGSGLGLSIVRDIARLYGGDIELDAAPQGGVLARLDLPAVQ